MIIKIISIGLILLCTALFGRWLIDRYSKDNELLRKLVHVLHGVGLASIALIAPMEIIIVIEVLFLISMVIARYLAEHFTKIPWIKYMNRMYSVGRVSFGEFFFPVSAIAVAFLADSSWEFAVSILILGVADAMAALVGKRYGKTNAYLVFGQQKSFAGSTAFFVVTLLIITIFSDFGDIVFSGASIALIAVTTLIVTISENLGVYGSDNLLIPLVAVLLLNQL